MTFDNVVIEVIVVLSGLSTVLVVADAVGLLPAFISKWLNRNRAASTMGILKELGIDVDRAKRAYIASQMTEFIDKNKLESTVCSNIDKFKLNGKFQIGSTELVTVGSYVDLMGATTDPHYAKQFARFLSTFWRKIIIDHTMVQNPNFDFVVTPKMGSPILGYEFAQLLNIPFIAFTGNNKFTSIDHVLKSKLDYTGKIRPNMRALIVDDSTTGGKMGLELITFLRTNGIEVTDFLVVFEPTVKNARECLKISLF